MPSIHFDTLPLASRGAFVKPPLVFSGGSVFLGSKVARAMPEMEATE